VTSNPHPTVSDQLSHKVKGFRSAHLILVSIIMGSTTSKQDGSSPPVVPVATTTTTTTTTTASREAMSKTENNPSTVAVEEPPAAVTSGGGCPMHQKDGTYSFDPFAAWKAGFPHGPSSSSSSGSQPPLKDAAAATANATTRTTATTNDQHQQHTEYNVYGQRIDPANQMPTQPHQQPAMGQQTVLSTERVPSTIPKVRNMVCCNNIGMTTLCCRCTTVTTNERVRLRCPQQP
jgi:Cytochrome c/c1 heme lyase